MSTESRFDTGGLIRQFRGSMTQEEFAKEMGVGRTTIIRYESNERVPDADFLLRLNVRYGADPMHVLTGRRPNTVVLSAREAWLIDRYRNAKAAGVAAIDAVAQLLSEPDEGGKL